jgi:hypothetical protein
MEVSSENYQGCFSVYFSCSTHCGFLGGTCVLSTPLSATEVMAVEADLQLPDEAPIISIG